MLILNELLQHPVLKGIYYNKYNNNDNKKRYIKYFMFICRYRIMMTALIFYILLWLIMNVAKIARRSCQLPQFINSHIVAQIETRFDIESQFHTSHLIANADFNRVAQSHMVLIFIVYNVISPKVYIVTECNLYISFSLSIHSLFYLSIHLHL